MKLYPVASFAVIDTRDDDVTRTGFIVHIVCYKCVSYSKEMYKKMNLRMKQGEVVVHKARAVSLP